MESENGLVYDTLVIKDTKGGYKRRFTSLASMELPSEGNISWFRSK